MSVTLKPVARSRPYNKNITILSQYLYNTRLLLGSYKSLIIFKCENYDIAWHDQ
jgi:hypothetical protein